VITRIEALNFRCLRFVQRSLGPLQILVGPNASGKSTFLDAIEFVGDLVSGGGPEAAFRKRTANPLDLLWNRQPGVMELVVEALMPEDLKRRLNGGSFDTIRYELQLRVEAGPNPPELQAERLLFKTAERNPQQQLNFPELRQPPETLLTPRSQRKRFILNKVPGGNDNFYSEIHDRPGKGWAPSVRLGPRKSALSNLIEDETRFPVATWFKSTLTGGIQRMVLNSVLMRQASPPGRGRGFLPDGSNLPWVVEDLRKRAPERFRQWVQHLATALPELEGIRVVERPDDRHSYLMLRYRGGLEAPSWVVSDGTLRLLALTILAYIPGLRDIFLIEEPENGIHPTAVETVYQSLRSVYEGQVLVATHSPILLAIAKPSEILCFAKTPEGATDIVRGDEHPAVRHYQGEVSLGDLFAAGVLG
jgi:energy-coupling factor transporter ATP-binding protein EcfA2